MQCFHHCSQLLFRWKRLPSAAVASLRDVVPHASRHEFCEMASVPNLAIARSLQCPTENQAEKCCVAKAWAEALCQGVSHEVEEATRHEEHGI